MTNHKPTILAVFTAAIAFLAVASPLHAGVQATSFIDITNFVIRGSNGDILDNDTDFNLLTFTSTAGTGVALGADNDSRTGSVAPIDLPVIYQ